jgi:predicted RNase H-like HicB family nuclease
MKNKYSTTVFWDDADECFIATCPEFPLLSAHGDTREEATSEFQTVLEMAIESFEENNLELPKPRTAVSHSGQFRLRISKSLHKGLAEIAEKEGVSLNSYVTSLITEGHTLKKAYADKIEVIERIMQHLASNMISQHHELQVHTKILNFLETTSHQKKPVGIRWQPSKELYFHAVSK